MLRHALIIKGTILLLITSVSAQVTLDEVIERVAQAAPESRINEISNLQVDLYQSNVNKNWLPQLKLTGQGTYQSDVTFLNVDVPGIALEPPSEFQYKVQAEVSQLLYDGGVSALVKRAHQIEGQIKNWQSQMQLEALRQQAIEVYFAIIEIREQRKVLDLKENDLEAQQSKLEAAVENGVVLKSELNELKAATIKLEQSQLELRTNEKVLVQLLSILCNEEYSVTTTFSYPEDIVNRGGSDEINRAFYQLQEWQKAGVDTELKMKKKSLTPKLGGFGQFGLGRPGLNFLDNELSEYYLVGLRMNIDLAGLYTNSNDRQLAYLKHQELDVKKEGFDRSLYAKISEYQFNVDQYEELIHSNEELLKLNEEIYKVAQAQLDNGVLTSADYLEKLNEVSRNRQAIFLSKTRKLKFQYLLNHVKGQYK